MFKKLKFKIKIVLLFFVFGFGFFLFISNGVNRSVTKDRNVAAIESGLQINYQINSDDRFLKSELRQIKNELQLSNCEHLLNEEKTVSNDLDVVRFRIKNCDKYQGQKIISYNIKNLSNGYEGQIFKENLANISTDYIQLQGGENIIELEISLMDGQTLSKKIKINRKLAF